jgi:hypothetical protein
MEKIKLKYESNCLNKSDINEHLPTIYEYGKKCSHVTEMGVRWISSTWALLFSSPKKIISYDIVRHPKINEVISLCKEYNIDFTFHEKDVLKENIEETELLFIDTLHTYQQLISELRIHSIKVSKYIILHDTVTYARIDEKIYNHASEIIKNSKSEKRGLMTAVEDFLDSDIGSNWIIDKHFINNNGLTILKKM